MSRLWICTLLAVLLVYAEQRVATAQGLPAFCESVDPKLLSGTDAPYSPHVAPNGTIYCEGVLSGPIGIPPLRIISVKQDQGENVSFKVGTTAVLTWPSSPSTNRLIHVKIRALKEPPFALDAE